MNKKIKNKNKFSKLKDYQKIIVYTTIPFQMAIIIGLGAWAGWKLDAIWHTKPILTIVLIVVSVIIALYTVLKDLL